MAVQITINEEKCTGDELCIDACPIPCYKIDRKIGKAKYINQSECLGCRNCEEVCPTGAISVKIIEEKLLETS